MDELWYQMAQYQGVVRSGASRRGCAKGRDEAVSDMDMEVCTSRNGILTRAKWFCEGESVVGKSAKRGRKRRRG